MAPDIFSGVLGWHSRWIFVGASKMGVVRDNYKALHIGLECQLLILVSQKRNRAQ